VLTCAYCGRQTRLPDERPQPGGQPAGLALPFAVHVVPSNHTREERMAMIRATNQQLIDDTRRRGLLLAIPIVLVASAAAVVAILAANGWIRLP
jgi:hypothetical protein